MGTLQVRFECGSYFLLFDTLSTTAPEDIRTTLCGEFDEIIVSYPFTPPLVSFRCLFIIVYNILDSSHLLPHISFPLSSTKSTCQLCVLLSVNLSGSFPLSLNVTSSIKCFSLPTGRKKGNYMDRTLLTFKLQTENLAQDERIYSVVTLSQECSSNAFLYVHVSPVVFLSAQTWRLTERFKED